MSILLGNGGGSGVHLAISGGLPEPRFDVEAFTNGLALRAEIEGTWGGRAPSPERYDNLEYARQALALPDR